jgi:hypothetical protein
VIIMSMCSNGVMAAVILELPTANMCLRQLKFKLLSVCLQLRRRPLFSFPWME